MANLAIKGHPTRGKEVIELLEMLGGKNIYKLDGKKDLWYILSNSTIEHATYCFDERSFILEEFLEKYPYKIGDKVRVWSQHDDEFFYGSYSCESNTIKSMQWNEIRGKVAYTIEGIDRVFYKEELIPYKEEVNMKENKVDCDIKEGTEKNQPPKTQAEVDKYLQEHSIKNGMNVIDIENCLETDGLKLPENVVINSKGIGSIQFIQWYEKTKYPKTYEECCKILDWNHRDYDRVGYKSDLLCKLQVLLLCRDAYWEIACEQMGLDKPWEPDWGENDGGYRYCIRNQSNKIVLSNEWLGENYILAFPTAEMRDVFYENFKDLIEYCKELL